MSLTYSTATDWSSSAYNFDGTPVGIIPSLPVTTVEAAFGSGPFDTDPTWTDISAFVQQFSTQRGRQHELMATEAGRLTLTLNNRDARFNTWNTSSPYAGGLLPLTPVKVTATWNSVESYDQLVGNDGPAGWWKMADSSETELADSSGGDNPMAYMSGTVTVGVTGPVAGDTAMTLSNAYFQTSTGAYAALADLTLEAWVNIAGSVNGDILKVGANATEGIGIGVGSGTTGTAGTHVVISLQGTADQIDTGAVLSTGTWHHVVLVLDSDSMPTVYVDGALVYTGSTPATGTTPAGASIGTDQNGHRLSASIAQCAVYSYSMTAAQILRHYNAANATPSQIPFPVFYGYVDSWTPKFADPMANEMEIQCSDMFGLLNVWSMNSTAYQDAVLADSPLMYWRCDDPTLSTTLTDYSGNNQPASLQPAGTSDFSLGNSGALACSTATSVQFTAGSSDGEGGGGYAAFSPGLLIGNSTGWTWEAWFQVPLGSSGLADPDITILGIAVPNSTIGDLTFELYAESAGSFTLLTPTGFQTTGTVPDDGQWHYVAIACDTSGSGTTTFTFQVDGTSGSYTQSANISPAQNGSWAQPVGMINGTGYIAGASPMQLNLQEVAVYGTVLTADQMAAHYAAGYVSFTQQQTSDENVTDAANLVGIPAALLDIYSGGVACQPAAATTSSSSTSSGSSSDVVEQIQSLADQMALQFMQQFETTEAGLLFVSAGGVLTFYPHTYATSYELYPVSTFTVEDAPDSADGWYMNPFGVGLDDEDLWNEVLGAAQENDALGIGGTYQSYTDPTSQAAYGKRSYPQQTGLLLASDQAVLAFVQWLGNQYHEPLHRVRQLTMKSTVGPALAQQMATMLGPDLWDMFDVTFNGLNGGTAFTQLERIEGVSHTVDFQRGTWTTDFFLTPAFAPDVLIVGSSTNGQLDSGNYLGW